MNDRTAGYIGLVFGWLLVLLAANCSDNTHGAGVNKDCGAGKVYIEKDGSCKVVK